MKVVTIKLYSIDELNKTAQRKAIYKYRPTENPNEEEDMESISAICKAIHCDYSTDYNGRMTLFCNDEDEAMILSGKRAMAYVWNNYIEPNLEGKYIFNGWCNEKSRLYHSKVTKWFDCPFTGLCTDMLLWDAWLYWKDEVRKFNTEQTVEGFICRVQYIINDYLKKDRDYFLSDEYAMEYLLDMGEVFTEEGEML